MTSTGNWRGSSGALRRCLWRGLPAFLSDRVAGQTIEGSSTGNVLVVWAAGAGPVDGWRSLGRRAVRLECLRSLGGGTVTSRCKLLRSIECASLNWPHLEA